MQRASVEIAATPDRVFAFMTDPQRVRSWQPDEGEMVVAAMTKNEHLAYEMDAPSVSARIDYRLVRWGNTTRLVSTAAMKPKGLLRPLFPFMKGMLQRKMKSRLTLLRDVVEAGQ